MLSILGLPIILLMKIESSPDLYLQEEKFDQVRQDRVFWGWKSYLKAILLETRRAFHSREMIKPNFIQESNSFPE
jgi:hypothetical protein